MIRFFSKKLWECIAIDGENLYTFCCPILNKCELVSITIYSSTAKGAFFSPDRRLVLITSSVEVISISLKPIVSQENRVWPSQCWLTYLFMYVSISYYEIFITNLLIFGPHPTSTTAMIVVIKCVNDNFKPTQETVILH